jgi:EAL domain-containing protein (putative c-di-GMP-specific phosphodiesterase class I)
LRILTVENQWRILTAENQWRILTVENQWTTPKEKIQIAENQGAGLENKLEQLKSIERFCMEEDLEMLKTVQALRTKLIYRYCINISSSVNCTV